MSVLGLRASSGRALPVAISGASGRMGRMLIDTVQSSGDARVEAELDVGSELPQAFGQAEYLIDFTRPEGTLRYLDVCVARGIKMVIGTTGFSAAQQAEIARASEKIAIVMAPNMSVGVNVTLKLLEKAARYLQDGYDVEIIEAHHKYKADAPSGTALKMGEIVAAAQGKDLQRCAVYAREGHIGPRRDGDIGFAAIRGGSIVGDHTVMFASEGERIEISHYSATRFAYADGSLRAVRFLQHQSHGLFSMFDVLGLND